MPTYCIHPEYVHPVGRPLLWGPGPAGWVGAEVLLVAVVPVLVDDCVPVAAPFLYTERRFPAPHFSAELPAHAKLQSDAGAATEPALKLFPQ
jgi:hypothetical protein